MEFEISAVQWDSVTQERLSHSASVCGLHSVEGNKFSNALAWFTIKIPCPWSFQKFIYITNCDRDQNIMICARRKKEKKERKEGGILLKQKTK